MSASRSTEALWANPLEVETRRKLTTETQRRRDILGPSSLLARILCVLWFIDFLSRTGNERSRSCAPPAKDIQQAFANALCSFAVAIRIDGIRHCRVVA